MTTSSSESASSEPVTLKLFGSFQFDAVKRCNAGLISTSEPAGACGRTVTRAVGAEVSTAVYVPAAPSSVTVRLSGAKVTPTASSSVTVSAMLSITPP